LKSKVPVNTFFGLSKFLSSEVNCILYFYKLMIMPNEEMAIAVENEVLLKASGGI
jgi:hypothetical protein